LRILHVIRPAEGGMKGHLVSLVTGLRDLGCTVEVACPGNSLMTTELLQKGLTVHPITLVGPLNPAKDIVCISELKRIIDRGNYDLVHFHGSKAGLVGRVAAVLAGYKKTVVTAHNFVIYEEVPIAKKIIYRYGESLLSRVTSKIITVSQALKHDLVRNYKITPEKIVPIYNGIDLAKYYQAPPRDQARGRYGLKPEMLVIGTVARMAPQKGLKYLIEAVAKICLHPDRTSPDILFVIAGDGPLKPELERFAVDIGMRDKVLFPGYIDDINELFACLDIFVIPSIAEGLSITTIEAMAAGLPVVASRVGGLPELVTEGVTGLLVEPRDTSALAAAINSLVNDREMRVQFGEKGKMFALDRFSIENMVEQTIRVYQNVIAG